jgi:hypothetical protein
MVGREIGVANYHKSICSLYYLDLTAGNGVVEQSEVWSEACTPGILARYALDAVKPVHITLYEQKGSTVGRLLESLDSQFPLLRSSRFPGKRYERTGLWTWRASNVELTVIHGSGAEADVSHIKPRHSVFVLNDPNAITDWAMRPGFCAELDQLTPWFRNISTMGCNVGGIKRLTRAQREAWFNWLSDQEAALPNHRDLLLVAIRPDSSQWAYLLCEPIKWRARVEREVRQSIAGIGKNVEIAWFRTQSQEYEFLKRELFLTKAELRSES